LYQRSRVGFFSGAIVVAPMSALENVSLNFQVFPVTRLRTRRFYFLTGCTLVAGPA
jgi:hypothetical protein